MAHIVFMRAVNVGKHQRLSVSALAKAMSELQVINLGAVGTFIVRKKATSSKILAAFSTQVPRGVEMMIVEAQNLAELVLAEPKTVADADGFAVERSLTIANRPIRPVPPLPVVFPAAGPWQVRIVRVQGAMIISHFRRNAERLIYPNEVAEKQLGVTGTTRNWKTVLKLVALL